jgi:hypothetical protein
MMYHFLRDWSSCKYYLILEREIPEGLSIQRCQTEAASVEEL